MIKVILILMLVNSQTGEVAAVQQPRGYTTVAECQDAAKSFSSNKPGFFVQFSCIESAMKI